MSSLQSVHGGNMAQLNGATDKAFSRCRWVRL